MNIVRGDGFIKKKKKSWPIVPNVVNFLSWRREGFERSMEINVDKSHY